MLNNVSLVGRLTRDPETKVLESGKVVSTFVLAVQRNKDEADFIPCETWGKTAESVRDYVTKGSLIGVEGTIRVESYDVENGKRTYTKVVANRVHFIDLKTAKDEEDDDDEITPRKFMTDEELANR
jgi:single-strand DNA-binding protein